MTPLSNQAFIYKTPWKSSGFHFGEHRGMQRGLGFEFRNNVSLMDFPDARRINLHQTILDPYEQVQVKLFDQNNTIPVYAVCDLSSSMQFKGVSRKLDQLIEVSHSIAYSAYEAGDAFSLISYNESVIEDLSLSLSHHLQQAYSVIEKLNRYSTMQLNANGIFDVPQYLGNASGLVFWISDFHMTMVLIEQTLSAVSHHQIVPVVIWDDQEYKKLPKFGFGNMIDPESGDSRTVFFRPSIRKKFEQAFSERKTCLDSTFSNFNTRAIYLKAHYDAQELTDYFEQI